MTYQHAVRVKTSRSIDRVEAWLTRNCQGAWTIRFDGVTDDLDAKCWTIHFEDVNDMAAFKRAMSQPGMPDRPNPMTAQAKPKKGGRLLGW